tara:strand:+ start:62 stop:682 length:621 start_codon:yes stop_codon:yes gene_type:complete
MNDSISYIDSWKNKEVFQDQLALNEKELNHYPDHWKSFVGIVSYIDPPPQSILDVGCGAGVFFEICRRHFPDIKYTGVDYAEEAIQLASSKWPNSEFYVKDYKDLIPGDAKKYDLLHTGALLDVLPNGDEALSFLLGLGFRYIILGRVKITEKASGFVEYEAYNKIRTYAYSHNIKTLGTLFGEAGYSATFTGENNSCTILLQKIQ